MTKLPKQWYNINEVAVLWWAEWETTVSDIYHFIETGQLQAVIILDGVITNIGDFKKIRNVSTGLYNHPITYDLGQCVLSQSGERLDTPERFCVSAFDEEPIFITRAEIERFEAEHTTTPESVKRHVIKPEEPPPTPGIEPRQEPAQPNKTASKQLTDIKYEADRTRRLPRRFLMKRQCSLSPGIVQRGGSGLLSLSAE